jgi:hypothetical protein
VIASDTPRQQRFASAFNAEWILAGGDAPVMFRFDSVARRAAAAEARARQPRASTVTLLAVDAADAARAKPYVGSIPSYTSSEVNERQPPDVLRDLDNVRFRRDSVARERGHRGIPDAKRAEYSNPALERLYALGMDAFRVAQAFADGKPSQLEFDGATGHLSLESTRQFAREGKLMQFRGRSRGPGRCPLTHAPASGGRAETLAADFLIARGLAIIERNFRCRRGEIDIIARDGDTLVFAEVRLRHAQRLWRCARRASPRGSVPA